MTEQLVKIHGARIQHQIARMEMPQGDLTVHDAEYTHLNHSSKLLRRKDLDAKFYREMNKHGQVWKPPTWDVIVTARFEPVTGPDRKTRFPLVVMIVSPHPDAAAKLAEAIRDCFYGDRQTMERRDPAGVEYCQWVPGVQV